jgi:hypothetical protein
MAFYLWAVTRSDECPNQITRKFISRKLVSLHPYRASFNPVVWHLSSVRAEKQAASGERSSVSCTEITQDVALHSQYLSRRITEQ